MFLAVISIYKSSTSSTSTLSLSEFFTAMFILRFSVSFMFTLHMPRASTLVLIPRVCPLLLLHLLCLKLRFIHFFITFFVLVSRLSSSFTTSIMHMPWSFAIILIPSLSALFTIFILISEFFSASFYIPIFLYVYAFTCLYHNFFLIILMLLVYFIILML